MNLQVLISEASEAIPAGVHRSVSDVTISFGVLGLVALLHSLYAATFDKARAPHFARLSNERGGVLFGKSLMNAGYWFLQPIGRSLHRLRISPNTITAAGLALALAAATAIVFERLGLAGVLLLGSALCDALDGMVARFGQNSSEGGAAFDAVTDRIEEIVVFSAIAYTSRAVPWVSALSVAAMTASLMNSYISAKGEVYRIEIPSGRMRRGERVAWVVLGSLLVPFVEFIEPMIHVRLSSLPLVICLGILAFGTTISAISRSIALVGLLKARAVASGYDMTPTKDLQPDCIVKPGQTNEPSSQSLKPSQQPALCLVAEVSKGSAPTR